MDAREGTEAKQTIPLRVAPQRQTLSKAIPILVVLLVVAAGIFSGLVFSSRAKSENQAQSAVAKEEDLPEEVKQSFSQTFRDDATGTIEKNDDLDKYSQGTHKLMRSGGESQTAYLTSTVLDLDEYVGKKVKVFGETFGSSQVGWLMDVGKVEEVN
jgi:hypothetical protein